MQIGDALKKIAKGERLTESEIEALRLFGNETQTSNQFITGVQSGAIGITPSFIRTSGFISIGKEVISGIALRLKRTTALALPSGTTTVSWSEEEYDDAGFFDINTSATNITIPVTGIYQATVGGYIKSQTGTNHYYMATFRSGVSYYPVIGAYLAAGQNFIGSSIDERTYEKGETVTVRITHSAGVDGELTTGYFTMRLVRSI